MATTVATPEKAKAITEIERLGFGFTEDPSYELRRLDPERRVQVRESQHYAPKDQVERYAVQMGESVFPPIIVTKDDWIIDGNTRVGASLLRKQPQFPTIVLDVSWESDKAKRPLLVALAATLNSLNGQSLTVKERREVARHLISLNWKAEQIARAIGVGTGTVTQVKAEIDAVGRIRKVGLSNGHMAGASLRALGKKPVLALNDAPFKELAELVETAGLNASEITDLAKQAKDTGSDEAALESLAKVRLEMGERIREHSLTGAAKPPLARQLRQHLGFVNRFEGKEATLVETNGPVIPQHIEYLKRAISVLEAALAEQEARA